MKVVTRGRSCENKGETKWQAFSVTLWLGRHRWVRAGCVG